MNFLAETNILSPQHQLRFYRVTIPQIILKGLFNYLEYLI